MPELVLALISICIVLPGAALRAWLAVGGARDPRPDPLEESAAAQRAARTAADTARASARAANAAELAEFDAEARRILDALDAPCVCSQVSTHEWDERTQTYRQRWTVPEHFTSCAKHWPATSGPTAELRATLDRLAELQPETKRTPGGVPYRVPATITTYGVPADCTCVPDHTRGLLTENTRVVHRADCALGVQ